MIHTSRTVTVGKMESVINEPIMLYRGDREVEIEFNIVGSKFMFSNGGNVIKSTNATNGQLVINTPTGENMFSEVTECNDGKVICVITKEMIDELAEVGFYSFQIRLFDESQVSRVTIPPVYQGIEIRNPIAAEDETDLVDIGLVDFSVVRKDNYENVVTFLPNGDYNKTLWEEHDVISKDRLNKVEDALYEINKGTEGLYPTFQNQYDEFSAKVNKDVKAYKEEMEDEVEQFERDMTQAFGEFKVDYRDDMYDRMDAVEGELDEVNSQLATIENRSSIINVCEFGCIGDGITDNKDAFLNILYEMNKDKEKYYTLYFPKGVYKTTICLETSCKNLSVIGESSTIYKVSGNYSNDSICLLVKDCEDFKCEGMEFKNEVINKLEETVNASRFYHIWLRNDTVDAKKVEIFNNKFIDLVSTPNSSNKPYNGSVWVGGYNAYTGNVTIYNNHFENSCGRVVYLTNVDNARIYNNTFSNFGYKPYENTKNPVGNLVFRILSSKDIHIYDNYIIGTTEGSTNQISKVFQLGCNDLDYKKSENIVIHNNTAIMNNLKNGCFIYLSSIENATINNNTVTLNATSTFISADMFAYSYIVYKGIHISNNNIYNVCEKAVMLGVSTDSNKMSVFLYNNNFYGDSKVSKLYDLFNNSPFGNTLFLKDNLYFINNILVGEYVYENKFISANHDKTHELSITSSYKPVDENGVLTLPKSTSIVGITSDDNLTLDIKDIQITGGNEIGREVTIYHIGGGNPGGIKIHNNANTIRLEGAKAITFTNFQSVTLIYRINKKWYLK